MKFAIVFAIAQCILIPCAFGEFSAAKYRDMHRTCVAQSDCPEEFIEKGRKGDFTPDVRFKTFLKCCFEYEDALDANGNILVSVVLDSFHDDLVEKYGPALKACDKTVSHAGDTLDYIYDYCYCAWEHTREKFDIP